MTERFSVPGLVVPNNDKLAKECGEGPYMIFGIEYDRDNYPVNLRVFIDNDKMRTLPANQLKNY